MAICAGSADLCAGAVFAWIVCSSALDAADPMQLPGRADGVVAILSAAAVVSPVLLAIVALSCSFETLRNCVDSARFYRHRFRNLLVFALAPFNLELLRLSPWHENAFDDFPTRHLLFASIVQALAQDALQLTALVLFVRVVQDEDTDVAPAALSLSVVTLAFSALSLCVRCLRKVAPLACASAPPASRRRPYWVRDPSPPRSRSSKSPRLAGGHGASPQETASAPSRRNSRGDSYADSSGAAHMAPRCHAMRWLEDEEVDEEEVFANLPASHHRGGVSVEGEVPWASRSPLYYYP